MTTTTAARDELMRMLTAKWQPPVVAVLAELGVADHLTGGPRTAAELAGAVGAHPRALHRVLRAAAGLGLFTQDGAGRFGLTPTAECLRSDVPGSLRPAAMMFALEPFWSPYAHIRHSVLTGEPAFDKAFGTTVYAYLAEHPEHAAVFGAAAAAFHGQGIEEIAAGHDWSRYGTVVDVGGGTGALLAAILGRHPGVRGVLFELPEVVERARTTLAELAGRVDLVAGDFFAGVPAADAYLVKSCLHNFADDQAVALLRVIRRAMPAGARLLVAETVVPAGDGPHYAKLDDIEMLVIAGGADRDEGEYADLLAAGGFTVTALTPCGDRFTLIEAEPRG
ncbi:methyltransferase [Phytohabitans sp. LJ34]|uniref:methyltransferase n=1 Tax=Phytohabitans sp. LJ34 TaxID=3452217 RepID=UPI003F8CC7C1